MIVGQLLVPEISGHQDVVEHHVARDLEINRTTGFQRHLDRPRDVQGRRQRIVEDGGIFGDFLIDLQLRLERLHLVVHGDGFSLLEMARAAAENDQRRFLGIGTCHRIDHVETAGAVGDTTDPEAVGHAGGAIGGEPDGRLMAQTHQLKPAVVFERFVEVQDEVAGNSKDVTNAVVPELIEEKRVQLHLASPAILGPLEQTRKRPAVHDAVDRNMCQSRVGHCRFEVRQLAGYCGRRCRARTGSRQRQRPSPGRSRCPDAQGRRRFQSPPRSAGRRRRRGANRRRRRAANRYIRPRGWPRMFTPGVDTAAVIRAV